MTSTEVRDAAARLVERTCASQGVPALIADPAALARLASFISAGVVPAGTPATAATAVPGPHSGPPRRRSRP